MYRVMPFGKHKGEPFYRIPDDYFHWLLDQEWLKGWLRREIEDYLEGDPEPNYRNGGTPLGGKILFTADERTVLKELLNLGYRQLAFKYHPDVGGRTEDMQRLNSLIAKIRASGLVEEN